MVRCLRGLVVVFPMISLGAGVAQEPALKEQQPEVLPAPKAKAPTIFYVLPEMPRRGTREVWQYYGIDSRGRFVPRVTYTPSVSFFEENGLIYPWTTTRPQWHVPLVLE